MSRINGIDPVKLSEQVEKLAAGAEMSDEKVVAETLNEKIHRLIHQDAIVLFMKGTPAEPFCKFRSVFGILITSFLKYKVLQHFFAFTSVRHFSISGQITLSLISEFVISLLPRFFYTFRKFDFSKQTMALWKEIDPELEFSHFNIFEDEEVREGIKSMLIILLLFSLLL